VILVLDTNVVVSGMLSPHGPPGRLVDMALSGLIQLAYDDRTLSELRVVLLRPRFRLPRSEVEQVVLHLENGGLPALAPPLSADWPDPDDAPFVEIAVALGVPLVTGDALLTEVALRCGATVLTPREALSLVAASAKPTESE